jgi:hypothetical protein
MYETSVSLKNRILKIEKELRKENEIEIVRDFFSNAMNQEQGNTNVNGQRPSSFDALSPLGYNDPQMKVMKDIPSSFQYVIMKVETYETYKIT